MYLTINKIDDANRVIKYDTFENQAGADARVDELKAQGLDAFAVDASTLSENFAIGQIEHLTADIASKTVTWHQDDFAAASEARAMSELRQERNRLLVETDWTQVADSQLADEKKTEWREYRQALRQLPATEEDVSNPTWPEQPS